MIYPIYMYGNTILKKKASKVKKGDIDIKKLSEDMRSEEHTSELQSQD